MTTLLRGILAVLCTLALCATSVAPAEAAKKRFRHAQTCAWGMPLDWSDKRQLGLDLSVGYWTGSSGRHRCMDQFAQTFRPTMRGGFTARVQWYRGTKVVKVTKRYVPNTARSTKGQFGFYNQQMKLGRDGKWRVRGKVITAKVRYSKRGFRTKTVRVVWFGTPPE